MFSPDGHGGVETVDAVGLDDYVRGVISAEMPSGWAAEALKVQAVAARTYAITDSVGGSYFDLYADTRSQDVRRRRRRDAVDRRRRGARPAGRSSPTTARR